MFRLFPLAGNTLNCRALMRLFGLNCCDSVKGYHDCKIWLAVLIFLAGCHDAADIGVGSGNRYCGLVVGSDDPPADCDGSNCSFIRRGFAPGTEVGFSFAPELGDCTAPPQGKTWAAVISSSDGVFECTLVDVIDPLQHDLLSQYDFPGARRLRNYIYTARVKEGVLMDRDVMFFVSVLDDNRAELRVVAGRGEESEGDYFGLFPLTVNDEACF